MNELQIIIKAVTSEAQKNMQAVKKELQGISQEAKGTSDKFGAAMKGIGKAAGIAIAGITAIITAVVALGKSTLEYQKQSAQLNAAFSAMGKTAAEASTVYKNFYRFLGDSATAVEASNLLIKLTQDEKNLTQWTTILQGVYASFPDSLPIEALVESANETARVGVVTGNLADALNWAGVSEDAFNAKLAQTITLEEREALIRSTLNGLYGNAAAVYERNNRAILEYNESQANLQSKMAELGKTITPLLTALNNLAAALVPILKATFETVLPYVAGFVIWLTEAVNRTAALSGAIAGTNDEVANTGNAISDAMNNAANSTGSVSDSLKDAKENAEAAKKAMMGFDELNVVPSEQSKANTGTGGSLFGDYQDFSNVNALTGSIDEFKKKSEEVAKQIGDFMDSWGWAIKLIGSLLAALSIKKLLVDFAALFGLGEKVAQALSFTGISAALSKVAGWLSAVIALLKEGNGFWAVMGTAFPKIAKAISAIGAAFSKVGSAIASAAKAVIAFIGGLSGATIAIIIAIIAAIASAVYYLWKNWDKVVKATKYWIKTNIVPYGKELINTFKKLWEALVNIWDALKGLAIAIWDAIPDSVKQWLADVGKAIWGVIKAIGEWIASVDWLYWIGKVFEWLGGIVVGILGGAIGGAISAVINLFEGLVQIITGAVQIISGVVSGLINLIVALFTGDFSKALDSVKLIWEGIKNVFLGAFDAVLGTVYALVKGIVDWFVHMWDVLVGHSIVPDTINAIIDWFKSLPGKVFDLIKGFVEGVINFFADLANKIGEWAVKIWDNIKAPFVAVGNWFGDRWNDVKNAFSNVGNWFSETFSKAYTKVTGAFSNARTGFANVWSNIKAGFGNVSDWFKDTFTKAWTAVKNVFSTGGKIFDGIKDGILEGLKAVINGLIGGINKVIAVPFNGINKALKSLKDIELVGIKPFDWISTISVPEIPLLAKGGIVDSATLAMIGERGKEAVVPLENNTGWMDSLVGKLAKVLVSDHPEKVVLNVDGKELAWAAIKGMNNITRQTGSLPLQLA